MVFARGETYDSQKYSAVCVTVGKCLVNGSKRRFTTWPRIVKSVDNFSTSSHRLDIVGKLTFLYIYVAVAYR